MQAERVLDAGERGCGEVTPLVRQELREMTSGQLLAVRAETPAVGTELEAWCRMTGHEFVGSEEEEGIPVHYIRRKAG
jgi:tRNA 2-thiouridine synthesizing protein A